ncbi:MAG: ATP-binding protein [Firmicutes bacterium]|nr:ATP-binding protein [Bacillota bacterium]
MIKRDYYLNALVRNMWNGEIKVITGIRRAGKSVLLFELFRDYLIKQGVPDENIIQIELDRLKYHEYRNPIKLCEYVESIVMPHADEKFYLFIDEVQFTVKISGADGIAITVYDMLSELKSHKNLDIYVTGSNSKMLSSDIATEFRGRAVQIRVYPLSFEEFYSFVGGDVNTALGEYMLYGGMPRITAISDESEKKSYLQSLFDELYLKDIVERNRLEREDILGAVLDFIASQIGSLTNPTNIANALTSVRRESVSPALVSSYLSCVTDAFLIKEAKRYDVKGKTYFNYPNKYYYTDIGLRNARLNYRQYDPGHIMENIIYNELVRRGNSVDIGVVTERVGDKKIMREIDFVVNRGDKRIYIQSAQRMDIDEKKSTELKSLGLTGDFFKKIVIRMDIPRSFYDDSGFLHCTLTDFLLGNADLF